MLYLTHAAMTADNPFALSASSVRDWLACQEMWYHKRVAKDYREHYADADASDDLKRGSAFDAIMTQQHILDDIIRRYDGLDSRGKPRAWYRDAMRAAEGEDWSAIDSTTGDVASGHIMGLRDTKLWQSVTQEDGSPIRYQVHASTTINDIPVVGIMDMVNGYGPIELKCPGSLAPRWDEYDPELKRRREWHEKSSYRMQVALQWRLCVDNGLPRDAARLIAATGEHIPDIDAVAFTSTQCASMLAAAIDCLMAMREAAKLPVGLTRCGTCRYCKQTAAGRLTTFRQVD